MIFTDLQPYTPCISDNFGISLKPSPLSLSSLSQTYASPHLSHRCSALSFVDLYKKPYVKNSSAPASYHPELQPQLLTFDFTKPNLLNLNPKSSEITKEPYSKSKSMSSANSSFVSSLIQHALHQVGRCEVLPLIVIFLFCSFSILGCFIMK